MPGIPLWKFSSGNFPQYGSSVISGRSSYQNAFIEHVFCYENKNNLIQNNLNTSFQLVWTSQLFWNLYPGIFVLGV